MWALLMLGIGAAGAIEESSPTTTSDTATARGTEWLVVPMVLYTPETKLMGGISALYSFPASTRPASSVPVALLVTQKSQYFGAAAPQIFLNGGRTRIIGEVGAGHWPDRFYGIGAVTHTVDREDYTTRYVYWKIPVQQAIGDVFVGPTVWGTGVGIGDKEPGGYLESDRTAGSDGGTTSGLGLQVAWDHRDRVYDTQEGSFVELGAIRFGRWLGSDYDFWHVILDARRFVAVPWRGSVLAMQGYLWVVDGEAPFYVRPRLGGSKLLRGYREGRYRDDAAFIMQAEYRLRVAGPWGLTVHGGVGNVGRTIGDLGSDRLKRSVGAGVRYTLNPEGMKLRVDMAWGDDGGAFYLKFGEAF